MQPTSPRLARIVSPSLADRCVWAACLEACRYWPSHLRCSCPLVHALYNALSHIKSLLLWAFHLRNAILITRASEGLNFLDRSELWDDISPRLSDIRRARVLSSHQSPPELLIWSDFLVPIYLFHMPAPLTRFPTFKLSICI